MRKSDEIWKEFTVKDICGNPDAEFVTIEQMVKHYSEKLKKRTEEWLESLYKNQSEDLLFTNFICGEANILNNPADDKFCKNSHQYRMPSATIKEVREKLSNAGLEKLSNFHDILDAVIDITRKTPNYNGVRNFGTLACYDFTLRYAYSRGIMPDMVYVHAGTQTGLQALKKIYSGIKTYNDKKLGLTFDASTLPESISSLGNL
ncbi:MAG: hypothetical protein K2J74_00360, partial [Muribaculaceae bacterium]|nr:hypothetical protein [Muribaculaceae bacterium]